jgi:hypothetical protein
MVLVLDTVQTRQLRLQKSTHEYTYEYKNQIFYLPHPNPFLDLGDAWTIQPMGTCPAAANVVGLNFFLLLFMLVS